MADNTIPIGESGTLEDNVQDDQFINIDAATQEVSAADATDSFSQLMVVLDVNDDSAHVDSYRYQCHTHHPGQHNNDYETS